MNIASNLRIRKVIALLALPALMATVVTAWGGSVGSVSVTEPADIGDAAVIARAKAQLRAEQGSQEGGDDGGGGSGDSFSSGCNVNIGTTVKPKVGTPVSSIITIVEGNVFTECNN